MKFKGGNLKATFFPQKNKTIAFFLFFFLNFYCNALTASFEAGSNFCLEMTYDDISLNLS